MRGVVQLLNLTLAGAVTTQTYETVEYHRPPESLAISTAFVRAGGGTNAKAWVQTSLDDGLSWIDIANFAFETTNAARVYHLTGIAVTTIATPGDAALADNTSINGILGTKFRVKVTTTGTYTGASSFKIWVSAR